MSTDTGKTDTLETKSSTMTSNLAFIKAASAPIYPLPATEGLSETQVKPQISAPSYLLSLKENEALPFLKPGKEAKPKIIIGTIMSVDEVLEMVAAADADKENGLIKFLGAFLVDKKIIQNYSLTEKKFLISLLTETIDYAAQRNFSAHKLSCLITIYLATHLYSKWYYWLSPMALWCYFKELMIWHTIEDSPDGEEVFEPEDCYDILTHFHTVYMTNLPLVHILTFGAYRLKLMWPFKPPGAK